MSNRHIKVLLTIGAVAGISALALILLSGSDFEWKTRNGSTHIHIQIGDAGNKIPLVLSSISIAALILGAAFLLFSKRESASDETASSQHQRTFIEFLQKLTTSEKDAWIGGVCGGLGEQTPIPAWVWRMIFAVLIFGYGIGVMAYILLWIFLPAPAKQVDARAGAANESSQDTV